MGHTPFSIRREKMIGLLVVASSLLAATSAEAVRSPLIYSGYQPYQPYQHYYQPYHGYRGYRGYHGYNYSPYYSSPYTAQTMMAYRAAPATAPVTAPATAPAAAPYTVGSQFHAQDEFGNLNYGYTNINSAKQEVGNTYGGVQGAYSYVDANGELQRVEYVADDLGFRVVDSRLPVAPVYSGVAPVFNPKLPVAPEDTPEVAAAKAAHMEALQAASEAAGERKKREAQPGFAYGFGSLHPHLAHSFNYNYVAPFNYHGLHNYNYGLYNYGLPYYG